MEIEIATWEIEQGKLSLFFGRNFCFSILMESLLKLFYRIAASSDFFQPHASPWKRYNCNWEKKHMNSIKAIHNNFMSFHRSIANWKLKSGRGRKQLKPSQELTFSFWTPQSCNVKKLDEMEWEEIKPFFPVHPFFRKKFSLIKPDGCFHFTYIIVMTKNRRWRGRKKRDP